jgi:hypothetical protein
VQESGTLQITLDYELDPFQSISLGFVLRNPISSSAATKSIRATVVLYSDVLVPATLFSSSVLQAQGKVIVMTCLFYHDHCCFPSRINFLSRVPWSNIH